MKINIFYEDGHNLSDLFLNGGCLLFNFCPITAERNVEITYN